MAVILQPQGRKKYFAMHYDANRLLVDGYSIIYAWPALRRALARNLERARDELTSALTRLQDATGVPITVVFDARVRLRGSVAIAPNAGVEIIFTRKGLTADAFIERQVANSKAPEQLLVATNDGAETFTARSFGGQVITADQLRNWLEDAGAMVERETKRLHRDSGAKFPQRGG